MVLAQGLAAPGEVVLQKDASLVGLTHGLRAAGEVAGRVERVGMVLAKDLAAPGEGVLVKLAGALVIAEAEPAAGQVVGGIKGVGMVLAETVAPGLVQLLS